MGIRFTCGHCGHQLHVKADLAGKRGICPKCQGRIDIPVSSQVMAHAPDGAAQPSTSSGEIHMTPTVKARTPAPAPRSGSGEQPSVHPTVAPAAPATVQLPTPALADPIAEAPHLAWYVVHLGSTTQYGPASGTMFRAWVDEGRVSPDSMVWRQDWPEWRRAADVLPQLSTVGKATGLGQPGAAVGYSGQGGSGPISNVWTQPARKPVGSNLVLALLIAVLVVLVPVVWWVLSR